MARILSNFQKHRRLWVSALVMAVLIAAVPYNSASACGTYFPCISDLVADVAYMFIWFVALVAGVIIAIESWFLQVILSISFGLVNSTPVKVGFPIVLSMANLILVGGLIFIAIATIVRQEQYGAKKILWKLVVMGIMINFGLVICGTLLSISDELSKFFIQSISPASSGEGGTTNYAGFADAFAGAFNPKAMIISQSDVAANPALSAQSLGGVNAAAKAGGAIGNIIKPFVAVLAALGSFIIIIITLGTMILMLMWRYVRLGIALIVLPVAWLSWVFPDYQDSNKKWWTKFTQWDIFPSAMLFFVYIGFKTSEVMNQMSAEFADVYRVGPGDNPVSAFLGALFTPVISQTLRAFILFGIMMGGMIAAQELGVKFADAGYKAIEGAGKGAKNWAKNRVDRATAPARDALRRDAARTGERFSRVGLRAGQGIMTGLEKARLPFLNKKKVIDNQGRVKREEKAPEEKLSGVLKAKADRSRDDLEDRLNPGGSLKQRKGETLSEWQERLGRRNSKFAVSRTEAETEGAWNARFREEAADLTRTDETLHRNEGESYEDWKARIIAAHPELNRREATEESAADWRKRAEEAAEKMRQEVEKKQQSEREKEMGLLASVWKGANQGFSKGAGHKHLGKKEFEKIMHDLGVDVPHEDHGGGGAEHPAPAPGGGGGGGGGGGHH